MLNTASQHLTNETALALIRPIDRSRWSVEYPWASIHRTLAGWSKDYGLNLTPEFQRGRVWTAPQQAHYIENVFRGVIPPETMVIQFNAPYWE